MNISFLIDAVAFQHHMWKSPFLGRFCSKSSENSDYGRQLGGFEYKEGIEPFKSKWRKPLNEREGFWKSKLNVFGSKAFPAEITRYNPNNFKFMSFKRWWEYAKRDKLIFSQQFIEDRVNILGCELAAAHFVVYRSGAVKFSNSTNWIRDKKDNKEYDEELPNIFRPEYILESIDLSETLIVYEGLKNIENLTNLKWLSFSKCPLFDNWCLDRVSGAHGENLEYLDISYTNITHCGLNALYRFKKLKTLVVDDWSEDPQFFLICFEMKKCLPELEIKGISLEGLTDEQEPMHLIS